MKLTNVLWGDQKVRSKRDHLSFSESFTFGQVIAIALVMVVAFISLSMGLTARFIGAAISFIIAFLLVRFNW